MLDLLHWLAALAIVAEALNKAERTDPMRAGLLMRQRVAEWLKALAWVLLALGGGGVLIGPLLAAELRPLADVCIALGFATLIVRTRVKEG